MKQQLQVNFKPLKGGWNGLRPHDFEKRKKFENIYEEGLDMQVSYNAPPQEPLFYEFKDHTVGLLAFNLFPRRLFYALKKFGQVSHLAFDPYHAILNYVGFHSGNRFIKN